MRVLKRAAKLFAVFALFVAVTVAIASFASPPLSNISLLTLVSLIDPLFPVRHWMYGSPDASDGPILFVHYYWGLETLVALLTAYFVVCLALAWCWTRIEARAARNARRGAP